MKKQLLAALALAVMVSVTGCTAESDSKPKKENASQSETSKAEEPKGRKLTKEEMSTIEQYTVINFDSEILAETLTGENTQRELCVYLPPSYHDSEKSYPVVYYLHGFGENGTAFVTGQRKELDEAFAAGAKEFILVSINGATKAGGSFFANSTVAGNWEDYIIDEVVPAIDMNFRTIAQRDSRGICGFSMGGFGAVNLSFKNPDVFCSFLAMSPGLLADGELPAALDNWASDTQFQKAYAQTFSPNENDEESYGNIPKMDGTPEDNKIVKDWENGYGNLNQKVEDYVSLSKPLKAMKIIYGEMDPYSWIPSGCDFLSKCLTEHKIDHSLEKIKTGHSIPMDVTETYLIPFFNENLVYEK